MLNVSDDTISQSSLICNPELFFNRELSWLTFNTRVLNMAKDASLPLLERLKFLAIYGTNLDEFYMIRVAGLKRLYAQGMVEIAPDRLSIKDQLDKIQAYIHAEQVEVENLYGEIVQSLKNEGLFLLDFCELDALQKAEMRKFFEHFIYPVIVPIVVDSTHPFPHMSNLSFALALELESAGEIHYALIKIPSVLKRFIPCGKGVFVSIESIIAAFGEELFPGFSMRSYLFFRVTRNADIEIEEEEADDFLQVMSEGLKARKNGQIVRLEFSGKELFWADLFAQKSFFKDGNKEAYGGVDIYYSSGILNKGALWEIVEQKDFAHLCFKPFAPRKLYADCDLYEEIKKQDILLFQPYDSFDSVIDFITQAARDESVLSIRMTLYRVGKDSPIVEALIRAAETKQVSVLVELKARFDEENNLHWARALEEAGAHVIYGLPHLKVHAKVALVIRQEGDSLRRYAHISTGNYNPLSAKVYTDISFFSANPEITEDVLELFHSLSTGLAHKTQLKTLSLSPMQIKPKILDLIREETTYGKEGHIILKANALLDSDVILALYEASKKGVKIDLLIRGICTLVPKLDGVSENISVFSLVGRYLEHARIYFFKHSEHVYFSSADLMPRNLMRRIELLYGLEKSALGSKLELILQTQLKDSHLYELQSNGEYIRVDAPSFNAQSFFETL